MCPIKIWDLFENLDLCETTKPAFIQQQIKSHNTIALIIYKLLHSHPHIRVSWIKAHVGYIGNEEAYRLAKVAAETEKFPETPLELPKSFIKTFPCQKMMVTWQMAWDERDTGTLIHKIIPKVSLQTINWTRNEVLFFAGHGLYHYFSKDSTLQKPHSVPVGESAHQSIMKRIDSSQSPTIWHHPTNNTSQSGSAT
ncbi:hypothetical protein AVEN_132635-1 [Araneus ventricosus]|uniref:RNase H type-1 domain-containing protein n=1 Tax=Araneus ventricosus TaxID=182803 RepID=A0A4Y2AVI1_ARAVE|nr:hypothetical protein AVEN_132635-1 [Araneus ventricosus]